MEKNWNWRCMLATMLVCNTHGGHRCLRSRRNCLGKRISRSLLLTLMGDKDKKKEWMDWMEKCELRHVCWEEALLHFKRYKKC